MLLLRIHDWTIISKHALFLLKKSKCLFQRSQGLFVKKKRIKYNIWLNENLSEMSLFCLNCSWWDFASELNRSISFSSVEFSFSLVEISFCIPKQNLHSKLKWHWDSVYIENNKWNDSSRAIGGAVSMKSEDSSVKFAGEKVFNRRNVRQ